MAGFLAWLIPGAGYLYLARRGKGLLLGGAILGLGSSLLDHNARRLRLYRGHQRRQSRYQQGTEGSSQPHCSSLPVAASISACVLANSTSRV